MFTVCIRVRRALPWGQPSLMSLSADSEIVHLNLSWPSIPQLASSQTGYQLANISWLAKLNQSKERHSSQSCNMGSYLVILLLLKGRAYGFIGMLCLSLTTYPNFAAWHDQTTNGLLFGIFLFFPGTDVVIVKSGRRICGTGGCLANAPLHQNKSYFEFKIQSTGKISSDSQIVDARTWNSVLCAGEW